MLRQIFNYLYHVKIKDELKKSGNRASGNMEIIILQPIQNLNQFLKSGSHILYTQLHIASRINIELR